MGFFLSEHSLALSDDSNQVTYITNISTDINLLLLSQVYTNQLTTRISILAKNEIKSYTGTIPTISNEQVLLKTPSSYENIPISEIINIQLESERKFEFHKNELQMDYFSDSYRKFETDFYKYSALDTPLTFLTDDIMLTMAKSMKNYFKLNKENAKDNRDHYFIFNIETVKESKLTRKYSYQKTVRSIK